MTAHAAHPSGYAPLVSVPSGRRPPIGGHPTLRRSFVALGTIPLFDGVRSRHLRRLARETDVARFESGRPIVEEGRSGEAMFVMLSGTAKVVRGGRRVAALMPGDFFGELSALDRGPRSASVVAETPTEVLRLYRHTLRHLLEEEPAVVFRMLEGLARRLRQVRPGAPVA